jgi:hypothetical protein
MVVIKGVGSHRAPNPQLSNPGDDRMHPSKLGSPAPARAVGTTAITAIMADPTDDPMCNKATRIAHEILKLVRGAAFEGGPFMITSLAQFNGRNFVACSCFHHTVLFMGKHALVLTRDEGSMVPWVTTDRFNVPDMVYFDCRIRVDDGLSDALETYVKGLMARETAAINAAAAVTAQEEVVDCAP